MKNIEDISIEESRELLHKTCEEATKAMNDLASLLQNNFNNYIYKKYYKKEEKCMKVMISQPMDGKSNTEIKLDRKDVVEKFADLHIEVINSIIDECADPDLYNDYHPALFYMAKSIEFMGQVDAVYFMKGWETARGCRIERKIAEEYGIKILEPDFLYPEEKPTVRNPFPNIQIMPCKDTNYKNYPYTITCNNKTVTNSNLYHPGIR